MTIVDQAAAGRWVVRSYRPEDTVALREICVLTGDSGVDATGLYSDDGLLPDIYLQPYLAFEPDLARVLARGDRPVGYVIGTRDSVRFAERYREEWLPTFTSRHPLEAAPTAAEREVVERGSHPERDLGPDQDRFPAHLHIDLLPEAQGRGWGRTLIRELLRALEEAGVPGVQLGVAPDNLSAQAFYRRLGFAPLPSTPDDAHRLGLHTDAYRSFRGIEW